MKCTATRGGIPGGWTWGKAGILFRGSRRGDGVCTLLLEDLGTPRRRFAGAERGSCVSQFAPNPHCVWVRAAEHALCGPFRVLKRRHGLAHIVERGTGVHIERPRVSPRWADASIERNGRRHVALRIDRAARLEFGRSRAQRLRKIMSRVFLGTPAAPPLTSG